jgi:hypothetical protein
MAWIWVYKVETIRTLPISCFHKLYWRPYGNNKKATYGRKGSGPPQRGRESTERLSHWREFRPHPIPNSCSPQMIVLGELYLVRTCRVSNSRFITVLTFGLMGLTLAKYPTKRLQRARSIKGMGHRNGHIITS